jgi:hypothetical protein
MTATDATTLWSGWDPLQASTDVSPTDLLACVGASGGDRLYELLAVAGRGFRPPRYLTVGSPAHDDADASAHEGAFRRSWSVEYLRIAETAPAAVPPFAIYLLGVNPPDDASDGELEVFNDFYTNVHLREVAERRHALRAERYERARVVRSPMKGAPRFLATYEVDEAGASQRRHVGPPYSKGPAVWQGHTTPWRLWYQRLAG